jgi:acetate kinase
VLERRDAGDADAELAYVLYMHRLIREIGAMAASAGRLVLLVMTGGVGENSATLRSGVAAGVEFLDVALEPAAQWCRGGRSRVRG